MTARTRAGVAGAAALVAGVAVLAVQRVREDRRAAALEAALLETAGRPGAFTEDALVGLPEPARRYLRHALAPGTPLVGAVRLQIEGTMRPSETAAPLDLVADQVLAPDRGFVWTARARMFGLPVQVRDAYADGEGSLAVRAAGIAPVQSGSGPDVDRSARGRLAAEAVWCPTALVPGPGVVWEPVDADRARVTRTIDGEAVPVTIHVGADGRLLEVTMDRWGDVGVDGFRPIPYGMAVGSPGTELEFAL